MPETVDLHNPQREQHIQEGVKARWAEKIEQHFAAGEYLLAQQAASDALGEFVGDPEFQGLALLAEHAVKRTAEAGLLLSQARENLANGKAEEALTQLRRAERLDERNAEVRPALVGALVERARALVGSDWRAADPLVQEALELDGGNPLVRSLASLIENYRRDGSHGRSQPPETSTPVPPSPPALPIEPPAAADLGGAASATVVLASNTAGSVPGSPPTISEPTLEQESEPPPSVPPPPKSKMPLVWGAIAIVAVIIAAAAFLAFRYFPRNATISAIAVSFSANTPNAVFTVDGQPAATPLRLKPGTHTAVATAVGYTPATQTFTLHAGEAQPVKVAFALQPELPELRVSSDLKAGTLTIDNGSPIDLVDGVATASDLSAGDHTLRIFEGRQELIAVAFSSQPDKLPALTAPLSNRGARAVVIASFGNSAKVYTSPGMKASVGNAPLQPVTPAGLDLSGVGPGGTKLTVADGEREPNTFRVEATVWPVINVILNGAAERIPFTVTADVPDAQILVNGTVLKNPMINGSRVVALPPGKYQIQVRRDGYTSPAAQTVEIQAGAEKLPPLTFALTPVIRYASLSITGAPAQTEVWIDRKRAGETDASGAFTGQVSEGTHSVSLRKTNFEEVSVTQDFKANETVRVNGRAVKPYGTVKLHIVPASAAITYLREGASEPVSGQPGHAISLPQGFYRVVAQADGYISKSATVHVVPGAALALDWALKAVPKTQVASGPSSVFENGGAWAVKGGWWIHQGSGFSFLQRRQGTFDIAILEEIQKSFLHTRPKRVSFFADYVDGDNYISYTLDGRDLTRRALIKGHAQRTIHIPLELAASGVYRFVVNLAPDSVTIKSAAGKTLDTVKTSGPMGKFGFDGDVTLVVH